MDADYSSTVRYNRDDLKLYRLDEKVPTLVALLGVDTGLRIPLLKPEIVIGRTPDVDILLHDDQISRRHAMIRCDPIRRVYSVSDLKSTNGTRLNLKEVVEEVPLQDGDKIFVGSTVLKFTLQDELESEHGNVLHRLVFTDDLTGLVLWRRFSSQLRFRLQSAQVELSPLALLMMDLDGLKKINDTSGHAAGAFIISQAGRMIGEIVNPIGQACRYGGDEFIAYLNGHDLAQGLAIAERIRAAIQDHAFEKDGKTFTVSISIGIAVFPEHARDVEALGKAADDALYRAKAKGRNCVSD